MNYVHISTATKRVMYNWLRRTAADMLASNLGSSSGSNSVSAVKDTYAPEDRVHAIPLLRLFTLQICRDESKQRVPMSLSPNSSLIPCLPLVPLTHITKKPTDHPGYQRSQCAPSKPEIHCISHANASIKMIRTRYEKQTNLMCWLYASMCVSNARERTAPLRAPAHWKKQHSYTCATLNTAAWIHFKQPHLSLTVQSNRNAVFRAHEWLWSGSRERRARRAAGESWPLLLGEETGGFVLICRFTPLSGAHPLLRRVRCAQSRLATVCEMIRPSVCPKAKPNAVFMTDKCSSSRGRAVAQHAE